MTVQWYDERRQDSTNYAEARFLDPLRGEWIEVTVQLADDKLYVFDQDSKARARWRYAEIVHAFRKE